MQDEHRLLYAPTLRCLEPPPPPFPGLRRTLRRTLLCTLLCTLRRLCAACAEAGHLHTTTRPAAPPHTGR